MLRSKVERRILTFTALLLTFAGLALATGTPASASTIKNGWIQLCAKSDYTVQFTIANNSAGSTVVFRSPEIKPGTCYWTGFDTQGTTRRVNVGGYKSGVPALLVGFQLWNSTTGLGIGAYGHLEGGLSSARLVTW